MWRSVKGTEMEGAAATMFMSSSASQCAQSKILSSASSGKPTVFLGSAEYLDANCFKPKSSAYKGIQVQATAQGATKINGTKVNGTAVDMAKHGIGSKEAAEEESSARSRINQLPDWSMLLAALATIFLAAEKQWTNLDWRPRKTDVLVDAFRLGRLVEDSLVFRQNFAIRSYEVGADKTASIETLMNHLQETALNHVWISGLAGDGFGATLEMSRRNLIWVVARMQIQVECYPKWGDIVEIDTWVAASGKNGMRRDWLVRDSKTGHTLTRATSTWVMMNRETRKLSKIPEAVREEIQPYFIERSVFLTEDTQKLHKIDDDTAHYISSGLTPKWSDLDVNQHVNNVKYIGWILESVPLPILENNDLASITLEYRRECGQSHVLQSLTCVQSDEASIENSTSVLPSVLPFSQTDEPPDAHKSLPTLQCTHLLRLQAEGSEIVRGRTEWKPKENKNLHYHA